MVDWGKETLAAFMGLELFLMVFGISMIITNSLSEYPIFFSLVGGIFLTLLGAWGFCRVLIYVIKDN